ncbi:phosphoglycerol transferase MdoB-like AlkP superfamily enzyme [Aeromonas hydrophila]|uniref:hypothetical protein n=1 Tax=Aeromonas hydrophila TaxID=644 RepID=UPI0021675817|nr:hypothetical protein [Aeromonas hydrophila]MCS3768590.1 phosphoglycerol transferase MdoB-like AlkP superfamily enzyme [Aeromonas hydrophila]MCS3791579.1 phosphoglycerol transferase MdoB-like AlkP superfamily enzyme [Aeromonas hydrophila]
MIKTILKTVGVTAPFIMHFIIMSIILILVLVNIKYGLEFDLIGTEHSRLVNGVYDMVYFLYFGSVISFAVLYFSYLLIVRWVKGRNKIQPGHMEGNK